MSVAGAEALARAHAVAVVLEAVEDGRWPADAAILGGCAVLLERAASWALVAELEAAA